MAAPKAKPAPPQNKGRASKIIKHGLEKKALQLRGEGKTNPDVVKALNALLKKKGSTDTLTVRALERYFNTLDKESIPAAHLPQVAEQNAQLGLNVAGDIDRLTKLLREWLSEAEDAKSPVYGTDGEFLDFIPDWKARTSVAREFRETLKFTADILERIYSQERIRIFQQTVVECVNEADPETARRIKTRFQANAEIMRARLLGL